MEDDINFKFVTKPELKIPVIINQRGEVFIDQRQFLEVLTSVVNESGVVENFSEKERMYEKAKSEAEKYNKLYHCTSSDTLLAIIESGRFRLSSLQKVNDSQEIKKINDPMLVDKVFVGCFTYDKEVSDSHWKEYVRGCKNKSIGVLFSINPKWFTRDVYCVLNDEMQRCDIPIYSSKKATPKLEIGQNARDGAYYIAKYDFLKVDYDYLKYEVREENELAAISQLDMVGIVKDKEGECKTVDGISYHKDWSEEKEIRLRIIISNDYDEGKLPFSRLELNLSETAFDDFELIFSPTTSEEDKYTFKKNLEQLLPNSNIEYK